jgi:hypothetical protein
MNPLPPRPAVPGAKDTAFGHSGAVVVATKVAWLSFLLWCPRSESPLAPHPRRCRRCEKPLAPSPTAVSSFRGSPGAGPPRWPSARVAGRSGSRPRHPLRGWLARSSPTPPRGITLVPARPVRGLSSPIHGGPRVVPPPPAAVSSLREAIGSLAYRGVVVAKGLGSLSHGGVVVRRIAWRRSPTFPQRESLQALWLRPPVPLRGWLARFSPTPSSRNSSCSRPSNQQFQPGAWPCSSGVEVGQAQAELRVGPPLRRRVRPVSSCATPRCDSQFFRLLCPQRCSIGLFAGAALRDSILHLPRRPSSYRHFAALFAPSPSPSSALRCQIRAVAHSPPACRSSMRLLAHPVLAPWMLYSPGNTTRPPRCERFSSRAQTPVSSLRHFGDAHASPTAPHSLPTRGSTPDGLSTGSPRGRIAICPPPL